jgi:hypothetical protein
VAISVAVDAGAFDDPLLRYAWPELGHLLIAAARSPSALRLAGARPSAD